VWFWACAAQSRTLLCAWSYQHPERCQGANGNVLVVHQVFFSEWQRFHDGLCFVLRLRIDDEDNALAIAARVPFADSAIEVELHGRADLGRHHGHDLLKGHTLPGSFDDQHGSGFWHRDAGQGSGRCGWRLGKGSGGHRQHDGSKHVFHWSAFRFDKALKVRKENGRTLCGQKFLLCEMLREKVSRSLQYLFASLGRRGDPCRSQHPSHAGEQQLKLRQLFFSRLAGDEWEQTLTVRCLRRLNAFAHCQGLACELRPESGDDTTHTRRIRMTRAQIELDDRPQGLAFRRSGCHSRYAVTHLIEGPGYCFDEQIVLAFKVPVEAAFREAYLLHHCADAAAVAAVLAERASGDGKNVLVVLRFVFCRVPHDVKSMFVI